MDYSHYTKSQLIDMLVELKWDFEQLRTATDVPDLSGSGRNASWANRYALFQPFVNDEKKCLLLIDTSYRICFINNTAIKLLGLCIPDVAGDRNIFDFVSRHAGRKLKALIDQTYFSGKKEKYAGLAFHLSGSRQISLNVTALRVRYSDQIAIRLSLGPV